MIKIIIEKKNNNFTIELANTVSYDKEEEEKEEKEKNDKDSFLRLIQ